ncbi:hypothetical protein AAVH_37413 [Aphelenchoides avenae]|nr:hypothetical protein AAVH_37413 [Aphelenchus avenae]
MNDSGGSCSDSRRFLSGGGEASARTSSPAVGGSKRRHEDESAVSSSSKRPARIGSSASLITLDDDDEPTTTTSILASEPVILHPKYKQLKAEMDEKVREIGTLNKKIEEEKIKFNCMWEKAVELEKNKDTMEREIAELKRRADGRNDSADE